MSWLEHRVVRQQWMLLGLIAVMCLMYGVQLFAPDTATDRFMAVPLEVTQSWLAVKSGSGDIDDISTFFTLVSCAFLHGSADHLVGNMIFLWIFGALAVELLGTRWMLVVFIATALAGSIGHTLLNAFEPHNLLGASGAVMGFEGLYLGMAVRWRLPDPHIFPIARPVPPVNLAVLAVVGISFDYYRVMDHAATNIAYGAHLGGFMVGLALACFVVPKPKSAGVR